MSKKKIVLTAMISVLCGSMLTVLAAGVFLRSMGIYGDDVIRLFGVMKFIQSRYVDAPDTSTLVDGAIDGMVASLGDPHSVYMPPEMFRTLRQQTEGSFGGIGVTMGFKDGTVKIISVLDGTPGEAAGLRAGDEILAVDGVPTSELPSEEVALRIRGEVGTQVTLRILHDGAEQDVTITRDVIQVHSVRGVMLDGTTIGYIRIASFSEHTADEFKDAYRALEKDGVKGMIIDLRENPGGLVTSCVAIANMIVPKGPVVSVVQKDGTREEYKSDLSEEKYPLVVLIDGNSASASEILAGALQDTGAATIVGETSYGKGSVQVILPLYDDDALKLTIAKYYTPSGRSIDGTGIEPDVRVEPQADGAQDVQLLKAIDVMKGKLAG